jgi:beta-glucosidase
MEASRRGLAPAAMRKGNNVALTLIFALAIGLAPLRFAAAAPTAPAATSSQEASNCPWLGSTLPIGQRVAMIMRRMSPADEIAIVEGQGSDKPYVFYMAGLPRLCVPAMGMEDGPSGVADRLTGVTQLPSGVALAATWDPGLAARYGAVIGAEQKAKGASVDLGPTINIDRDPRWGRSFESFSEDPYLTAVLATAEIDGIQSQGTMAQVKHFAVYNQETNRNTRADNAIVAERALHEIYLPAFHAAIRGANAASMMCGYATVNGTYSCQNSNLLTGVLRREWNFPGFVTSDYQAIHATAAAGAGTDMEQPFSTYFGAPLLARIKQGTIPRATLNTMVARILTEMFRFGLFDHPPTGSISAIATTPADVAVATAIAEAGTVLLKNDHHTLPLLPRGKGTIAVIGTAASASPTYAGGGSAYVIPSATTSPLAGIDDEVAGRRPIIYVQGLPTDDSLKPIPPRVLSAPYKGTRPAGTYTATLTAPQTGTYVLAFDNPCQCYLPSTLTLDGSEILSNPGTPPVSTYSVAVRLEAGHTYALKLRGETRDLAWATPTDLSPYIAKAVDAAKRATAAIVVVSDDTESEAADRPRLALPSAQNALIAAVAAANPRTIVVIDAGAPIAMPWLDHVAAVLDAWYPGQANGTALAAILFGASDPGGHLPITFPRDLGQIPTKAASRFPGVGGQVHYGEGLDVGYRWYDAMGHKPLFPFGFGLSYTRFVFRDLRVEPQRIEGVDPVVVTATVTNAGSVAGSDVVQLYLGMPFGTGEPPRKLVGFERIALAPGQSTDVRFVIPPRQTWWWHGGGWDQTPGSYRVYVGDSSALNGLPLRASFQMATAVGRRRVMITAPARLRPGESGTVTVTLTAGGDETLYGVRLRLVAPEGWTVEPAGPPPGETVPPTARLSARFRVRPPAGLIAQDAVLYATAPCGSPRSAGATVQLRP